MWASSPPDRVRLVEVYQGNPLALKIVAQTIVELFGGSLAPFLEQGEVVFGGVRKLLVDQYARLTGLEQMVVCWLAIMREPMTLSELRTLFVTPKSAQKLLEAVDGLLRRSLIESGQRSGSFYIAISRARVYDLAAHHGGKSRIGAGASDLPHRVWTCTG